MVEIGAVDGAPHIDEPSDEPSDGQGVPQGDADGVPQSDADDIPQGDADDIPQGEADDVPPIAEVDGALHAHAPAATAATVVPDPDAVHEAAGLFRAAGDPERLRLLAMLDGGERCVSELAAALGAGMSTVSQRLRVLRTEGLVSRRRDGKHAYYRLADDHVADLIRSALAHASEPDDHRHQGGPR